VYGGILLGEEKIVVLALMTFGFTFSKEIKYEVLIIFLNSFSSSYF